MVGAVSFLLAAGVMGIQFGWTPLPEGGHEYVVQVEPALMSTFEKEGFSSDVPPELRDIRRIVIQVGSGPVPNRGVTALKPPLEAAGNLRPPAASVYDARALTTAPGRSGSSAADQRPSLKTMFQADDDDERPKKAAAKSRSDVNLTADESRFSKFDPPGKMTSYESDASTQSPSHLSPKPSSSFGGSVSGEGDGGKPWLPLSLAMVALFASIGGNVYLGWLHYGTRRQYQAVVEQLRAGDRGEAYPIELSGN